MRVVRTNLPFRNAVARSTLGHVAVIGIGSFLVYLRAHLGPARVVNFDVIENPAPSAAAKPVPLDRTKPPPPKNERRAVFGHSATALSAAATDASAPAVKAGNTVAKEADHETLRDDDSKRLPVPADEYLVTAMPKLASEIRIPYPAEAKRAGVEGPVLFELLIDASGKVREATLVRGPGFGLNEAALAAVRGFTFSPARVQDKPVAVKIRYAYRFVLER